MILLTFISCRSLSASESGTDFRDTDFKILGFKVGVTTLNEIKKTLGNAKSIPRKEGESESICYQANNIAIIFKSGAMGGWEVVTGFRVMNVKEYENKHYCFSKNLPEQALFTDSGIGLGTHKNVILSMFGEPEKNINSIYSYFSLTRQQMNKKEFNRMKQQWPKITIKDAYWDVSSFAEFVIQKDLVIGFSLKRIESN